MEYVEVATTMEVDNGGVTVEVGVDMMVTFWVNDKVNAKVVVGMLLSFLVLW